MELLLCLQIFAPPLPSHLHPLPYPPSQPGIMCNCCSHLCHQNCLWHLDSLEGAPDLESEGHMFVPPVLSTSAVDKAVVWLSYQHDGAQHSLAKQAEAQGALIAGAVAKVQVGGAAPAPLHPDEGLDLSVHLELHYGLDQWPVGTTSGRMNDGEVCVGATAVCLSVLTLSSSHHPSHIWSPGVLS